MSNDMREMTLSEYIESKDTLGEHHLINRQLRGLREYLSQQRHGFRCALIQLAAIYRRDTITPCTCGLNAARSAVGSDKP